MLQVLRREEGEHNAFLLKVHNCWREAGSAGAIRCVAWDGSPYTFHSIGCRVQCLGAHLLHTWP